MRSMNLITCPSLPKVCIWMDGSNKSRVGTKEKYTCGWERDVMKRYVVLYIVFSKCEKPMEIPSRQLEIFNWGEGRG